MALTLSEIDEAIRNVAIHGQSYTLRDGRTVTHANLAELRALRAEKTVELGTADGSGYGWRPVAISRNPHGGSAGE